MEQEIMAVLENVANLGRDGNGDYLKMMTAYVMMQIEKRYEKKTEESGA